MQLVVIEVQSESFELVTECCHYNTRHVAIVFHHQVWYRVLSLRYVCTWKFRHHPHPLGYFCAKFGFFCSLHCWTSPWRKTEYQSLNHSLTQLFWCLGNRTFRFRISPTFWDPTIYSISHKLLSLHSNFSAAAKLLNRSRKLHPNITL